MAGAAFSVFHRLMFYFCGLVLLLEVVVALKAQLAIRFDQQALEVRRMRIMAAKAFAVLCRLVLRFGHFRKRIVARGAEGRTRL